METMFGSFFPPVVCLCIVVSNTYCVVMLVCFSSFYVLYVASVSGLSTSDCPFVLPVSLDCPPLIAPSVFSNVYCLCLVYPMLPVSLDCRLLISPSVFSNVYCLCLVYPMLPVSMNCSLLIAPSCCQCLWIVHF